MFGRSIVSSSILGLAATVLLASTTTPSNAFAPVSFCSARSTHQKQQRSCNNPDSALCSSPSDRGQQKPDLVDKTLFKAAIDRVNDEIEAQYRTQRVAEGVAMEEPTEEEQRWLADQARAREDEANNKYVYLVGKLDVVLPIDTQPELDLTESIGPVVLVTSVWGRTAEATGMQEFDTLTKVSVDDPRQPFTAKTKCTTLEETAGALTAAAQHAISLGKMEIQLEVQRLIKGYYAPDESV